MISDLEAFGCDDPGSSVRMLLLDGEFAAGSAAVTSRAERLSEKYIRKSAAVGEHAPHVVASQGVK